MVSFDFWEDSKTFKALGKWTKTSPYDKFEKTIVNRGGMVMELDKVLCCMLLFCFLALTLYKTQYM